MENIIKQINVFLEKQVWCDFEIISLKGDLIIGGKTTFSSNYDLQITFEDVFYLQCSYEWKTNTKKQSFFIASIEDENYYNFHYEIVQGNTLFKIIPAGIKGAFFVSAKNVRYEILGN